MGGGGCIHRPSSLDHSLVFSSACDNPFVLIHRAEDNGEGLLKDKFNFKQSSEVTL